MFENHFKFLPDRAQRFLSIGGFKYHSGKLSVKISWRSNGFFLNPNRQSNKEAKKEECLLQEKRELSNTISDLALQIERQDAQIREMNRVLADIGNRINFNLKSKHFKSFLSYAHRFSAMATESIQTHV